MMRLSHGKGAVASLGVRKEPVLQPDGAFVVPRPYVLLVTLGDVTSVGVLAAIAEFDRLGRDAFLKSTHFGRARAYYLQHDGKLYDSKAIAGYAHKISVGTLLGPRDFSGGDKTVAQRMEALGFTVLNVPTRTRRATRSSWRASWWRRTAGGRSMPATLG